MNNETLEKITGQIVEDDVELSLADLCQTCGLPAEWVLDLVEYGVIEPVGSDPAHWRFHGVCVRRVRRAHRLETDLGLNTPGIALALDLLEEVDRLRARLHRLEG